MTGGLLVALYLFTLAIFLGLDVIRKVPPTLQGALAVGMGAAAALVSSATMANSAARDRAAACTSGSPALLVTPIRYGFSAAS